MKGTIVRFTLATAVCAAAAGLSGPSPASAGGLRAQMTPADRIPWPAESAVQEGTAMQRGLQTVVIAGDARAPGLYTMMVRLPPHTKIPPHSHPDERSCLVLSGTWYFAYGAVHDESQLTVLPPGSHYTEPAGMNHFAQTRDEAVVAACTAVGPTGTTFVDPSDDPRKR
ncbi:MAG TPA: cupin domain-containing protein [Burkholderiales bacterium]|nr:cupin domain-containing protein [Burkholderiales bacterium]